MSSAAASSSKLPQKVAVIGATGRLGRKAALKLCKEKHVPCKILLRRPVVTSSASPPAELTAESDASETAAFLASLDGVEVVQGDVTNPASLKELLSGCTSCLALFGATRKSKLSDLWSDPSDTDTSHPKQVNYLGVRNILDAARASKTCHRIVRITGKGEDPNGIFSVLINLLGSMAKAWNYEGERLLRDQTDVDYTIIRPGIMSEEGDGDDDDSKKKKKKKKMLLTLADDGQDLPVSRVKYEDIASLSVDCLDYPNAARSTLTAMTTTAEDDDANDGDDGGAETYAPLLERVQPDRRVFPTDMFDQHVAAVKKAIGVLMAILAGFIAVLFQIIQNAFFT